ncbi:MAG: hypothetical protein CMC65_10475, partial [Flavobacteriaceae bacterium]|nr:hypothetical protein [Flavobacteriaceae bacterium]
MKYLLTTIFFIITITSQAQFLYNIGNQSIFPEYGPINIYGQFSFSVGARSQAIGDFSTAMGNTTRAVGDESTAMGSFTEAIGDFSTAMGTST